MILIREMRPNDLPAIARVNIETFRTTHRGIVSDAFMETLSYEKAEQRFQLMLANKERLSATFVAEDSSFLVGYAMGGLAREKVQTFDGELYGIYVLPAYHHRGIGRQLVSAVSKRLIEQGAHSMFVVAFSNNGAARQFYEALRGQQIHERTAEIGGANVEEVIYGWSSLDSLLHDSRL